MSATTAAQKSMEHTPQELAEVIDYYNTHPLEPKVFPAHQRKLLDTVAQLAFPRSSAGGDTARMSGRLVRMTDPDKISFVCRAYLAEARARGEETDPGLLFSFLNRYHEHVTPDFIAQRAQAEREKAEALAARAEEAAAREAAREAEKEEKRAEAAARKRQKTTAAAS